MRKHIPPLPTSLMRFSLALLFPFLLLAACGSGPVSLNQAMLTAASATEVEDRTVPDPGPSGTVAPTAPSEFDCASVSQIPSGECQALVALYDSTNGPGWDDNTGWLATVTPCTWSGIECTGGHVSGINLGYNQLYGPIPAEVGDLSALVSLEMSVNQLMGFLPPELGNLGNLQTLALAYNQLSGSISPALGKSASLKSLTLSHNQFSGAIPAELDDLVNLTQLYLSHNQLSGSIPVSLENLSKLEELDLSYNQLRGAVPESVTHIVQRTLWGNQLEGTITASGQGPIVVDYEGVHFSADPSLANSIWPEVKPATPLPEVLEGPSYWLAIPEHIRFTFADPGLPPSRRRMGFNLAAEAQILVFPLAELIDINPLVQTQIEMLRNLLAERGTVPSGELPLLPLTNSAQVFHAQAQYLVSGNIHGLRFVSQHSQDPAPIILSQELFYTFQGFTADGAYYVAAFFPLTTSILPDTIEVDDWDAFYANYDTYLSETTTSLDQLPPDEFTPDLTLLDVVVTSLRLEANGVSCSGSFSLPLVAPPISLIYKSSDGL